MTPELVQTGRRSGVRILRLRLRLRPATAIGGAPATLGRQIPVPVALDAAPVVAHRHGRRDYIMRRALAAGDLVAGGSAVLLVAALGLVTGEQLLWALGLGPAWLFILRAYGLYETDRSRIGHILLDDVPSLGHAVLVQGLLLWLLFQVVPAGPVPFQYVALAGAIAMLLLLVVRGLVRPVVVGALGPERCLMIGAGPIIDVLARKMRDHPEYGVEPVALLSDDAAPAADSPLPVVGPPDVDITEVSHACRIERVIVAQADMGAVALQALLHRCRQLNLKVSVVPQLSETLGPGVELDELEGITMLGINPCVLSRSSRALKRGMDIVGAGVMLLFTAPLLAAAALAIKLDSRGPVLFRQHRIGRGGVAFELFKLRTMSTDAEARRQELLSASSDPDWLLLDRDPRITRVGRYLRLYSIDELPQLINVLKGDMSLVGPRPLIESEDSRIEGWRRSRVDLTPGLTGLWQVLGRTRIPFEEMVKLDYLYLTNWSLWSDVRLILRTVPAVVLRRGAN